jgi:hypothetical protein
VLIRARRGRVGELLLQLLLQLAGSQQEVILAALIRDVGVLLQIAVAALAGANLRVYRRVVGAGRRVELGRELPEAADVGGEAHRRLLGQARVRLASRRPERPQIRGCPSLERDALRSRESGRHPRKVCPPERTVLLSGPAGVSGACLFDVERRADPAVFAQIGGADRRGDAALGSPLAPAEMDLQLADESLECADAGRHQKIAIQ